MYCWRCTARAGAANVTAAILALPTSAAMTAHLRRLVSRPRIPEVPSRLGRTSSSLSTLNRREVTVYKGFPLHLGTNLLIAERCNKPEESTPRPQPLHHPH